ncbi:MAG: rhodanese-like domain-containing protein [Verrucomicrobiota bacterium]
MKTQLLSLSATLIFLSPLTFADPIAIENDQIDYPAFLTLAGEVHPYREDRRLTVDEFLEMAKDEGTLILDTRSKANYDLKHIEGAVHLNFSEITTRDLERVVPSKDTRILIYCNNNFRNNSPAFVSKSGPLALNIPTFITLYGYGYKNIYELGSVIDEDNSPLKFGSNLTSAPQP